MTLIPLTRIEASARKQNAIRNAVRAIENAPRGGRVATLDDTDALTALLADPRISDPIYSLPKPVTRDRISTFICNHLQEQQRGEGVLLIAKDGDEAAANYKDIQFWPEWSACELGGAIRVDLQGGHAGERGATASFEWLFIDIGVDLICETAAVDNIRTAKLLTRIGFQHKGNIDSELPGGGTRPSQYWEMTRADWTAAGQ